MGLSFEDLQEKSYQATTFVSVLKFTEYVIIQCTLLTAYVTTVYDSFAIS